ncbi:MAG: hypothetical protein IKC97_06530 [Clostridia bacterium]|nr:hypothetical protein [Clostridia bacterium]
MKTFHSIPIEEYRLLASNIIFTLLLVIAVVAMGVLIYTIVSGREQKTGKKQLKKLQQQRKRRRKNSRADLFCDMFILTLSVCFISFLLVAIIIPGWTDYIVKDYIVYIGEFEVDRPSMKSAFIVLEDGTTLQGGLGLDEGRGEGTIVYAKRSRTPLGFQK